jgi:pyruvate,water dikinase
MALELKLESNLDAQTSFAALKQELEGSDAGQKWLAAFEEARYPWFWISTGTGWFHHNKSWNDDLDVPLASIKMHIESLQAGKDPSRPTEKLIAERDRIVEGYLDLFQDADDRKAFEEALGIARKVFPYVENHLFYVEHWFHSVFWNKMRELSAVLVDGGMIKDVEDIWYLNRSDIKVLIDDMVRAWATGIVPAGRNKWPKEIEWRKGVMAKFREWTPPPALGVPPEVVTEPFSIVLWGVTTDVLKRWLSSLDVSDGDVTELFGSPGSSGVVEGKARVIKKVEDLALLQAGEILVAPTTSPSWAPAFTKIAGAVTDVGGPMCHAAIVCREYGLPTVVGTGNGTSVIKTGDLIKIDGDSGLVNILK